MWALLLMGLAVIVLLVNARGARIEVDLLFTQLKAARSMIYLGFLAIGVVIGILLK